jgi:hypothetical protein
MAWSLVSTPRSEAKILPPIISPVRRGINCNRQDLGFMRVPQDALLVTRRGDAELADELQFA